MGWRVEYTDEFGAWYEELPEEVQDAIDRGALCIHPLVP